MRKALCLLRSAVARGSARHGAYQRPSGPLLSCSRGISTLGEPARPSARQIYPVTPSSSPPRRPWWQAWAGFLCGLGVGVAAVGAGSVVFCRPFDTPPYLIPYYLRDVRSRFNHYASAKKRRGGPSYMNVNDFVLALLASPDTELADTTIASDLKQLFDSFDANGDGYISFPEFRFLLSLLICKNEDVRTLFRIVDDEGVGTITLDQFADVLRGLTNDEAAARSLLRGKRNGVIVRLFGDEADPRRCSYEELANFIDTVRTEVWKAEFRLVDTKRTNRITAEQFSELLARQVLGAHLPYYIVENIRKLRRDANAEEADASASSTSTRFDVSLEDWISFHRLMLKEETLAEAMELYCASGLPMTRQSFKRVLRATDTPLPDVTVDIVFAVFDKDSDGTIAIDEFMYLMKQKISYHYQTVPRMKKSLPTRLRECTAAAWADLFE